MSESIPIISHTSVPTLSLPTSDNTTNTTQQDDHTLKVKRSRPRLLKRLSAQSLLTRSKHNNGSSTSFIDSFTSTKEKEKGNRQRSLSSVAKTGITTATKSNNNKTTGQAPHQITTAGIGSTSLPTRKPSFSLSTPSITIATYQKEVVTSTAIDLSQQQQQSSSSSIPLSSSSLPSQQDISKNKKNEHRHSSIIIPSVSSSSSSSSSSVSPPFSFSETLQSSMPHANTSSTSAIITTTTTTAAATTTTSSSSSHDNQPQTLTTSTFPSTFTPSPQHHLRKSASSSSLLSHTLSRRNSSISLSQEEEEEEEESDDDSSDSDNSSEEEYSDDSERQQYNHSMPLLSQHTVHQLVPGSVAAQCDYPLASTKRNMEFHTLFRSVPELDPLIEVYKCALQKDILLQGHIYITEHHLCFNANIFGWVTNLVIAFSDITSIEKRMTAMIIPNGIQVSTVHAKHILASFMSRDMAFDQMYKVWQIHHDKVKVQTLQPRNNSDFAIKQHDESDDDLFSESDSTLTTTDSDDGSESSSTELVDEGIVKPPQHCECNCGDNNNHLQQVALDSTFKATLSVIHELLFQSNFYPKILKKYEGCQDFTVSKWDGQMRESFYKRQLSNDEGLHIRCFRKDELVTAKYPYYCAVESTIRAPDTPMGAAICLRIRTCMTRVTSKKVRVYITFQTESSQPSPIKSLVENDIFSSQKQFHNYLDRMLKTKSTRKRIQKMMKDTKHCELDKDDINIKKEKKQDHQTIISYVQNTIDCGVSSCISVISSIFHVLFSLNGTQMMTLGICIALFTNVLMAYRLSNISNQLNIIEHSKKNTFLPLSSSYNKKNKKRESLPYNTYGVYQLEQSIDILHDAMYNLQNDVRDQSDKLYRLRRL